MTVFMLTVSVIMLVGTASLTPSPAARSRCAVVRFRVGIRTGGGVGRFVVGRFVRSAGLVVDTADCNTCQSRLHYVVTGCVVPLEDFLPMPSLSTTSSAHWMRLRSAGSALKRSTPEGAERRRTGCGRTSVIVLPPCGVGVAVRIAPGEAIFELDMMSRGRECSIQALGSPGCGTMGGRGGALYAQGPNEASSRGGRQRGTGRAGERDRRQSRMAQQRKGRGGQAADLLRAKLACM
jgi:hypothetical protein